MNHEIYPFCLEHPNPKLDRFQLPVFEMISLEFGHILELVHEYLKRRRDLMQTPISNTIHDNETQEAEKGEEFQNA